MPSKAQLSGMRGVYLAAAELARLGYIVSPTSRSAAGADILATTHDCNRAFSVQVKTKTSKDQYFMLGQRAATIKAKSHIYVLVHIRAKKDVETIDYYIVPAPVIAKKAEPANPNFTDGFLIKLDQLQEYRSKWTVFGHPEGTTDEKVQKRMQRVP